jgi:hypothetical protein
MADVDYGYGDSEDYGYGDASPEDYGYGDSTPDEYGYGDDDGPSEKVSQPEVVVDKRPKRRCSVTKFNLDQDSALTAADRIRDMRSEAPPSPQPDNASSDDNNETDDEPDMGKKGSSKKDVKPKKGALNRLRKRLSVAF